MTDIDGCMNMVNVYLQTSVTIQPIFTFGVKYKPPAIFDYEQKCKYNQYLPGDSNIKAIDIYL